MNSRCKPLIVALLAAWSLTAATAAAQTTLRYQFKEGDNLKYTIDQKMKMTMDIMGKAIDMNMNQTSDMVWSIKSVDSQGNAKIAVKFGRNKMTMDGPQGKTQVDSESTQEPDDPVGQILYKVIKGLSGLEVSGTISATGEYSDIKVPEKAVKELQNLPGGEMFGDMFSADGIKRMMSQSGLVMPKEAIEKGKTWKSKSDLKMPFGKMIAEIEYTYAGPTEKDGRMLEKITLKPKATIEPSPDAKFAMKLKSHEGSGAALFDNAAGRLLEVTNQQNMDMEIEVAGMTINQRIVQTTTMRLTEKK